MTPSDSSIVNRRVALHDITQADRLDIRLSCLKVMFGTTIGINDTFAEWCPDEIPPSSSERIAWLWFCRPDLAELLYTAATEELRELISMYDHDRMDEWWKLMLERPRSPD